MMNDILDYLNSDRQEFVNRCIRILGLLPVLTLTMLSWSYVSTAQTETDKCCPPYSTVPNDSIYPPGYGDPGLGVNKQPAPPLEPPPPLPNRKKERKSVFGTLKNQT